jgi:glycosyltransferase involved in cell wall biosynthesis
VLVPPADPAALKNAILALRSDSTRRHALGRAAREAAGRFTPERMVVAYLDFYRSAAPGVLEPVKGSAG